MISRLLQRWRDARAAVPGTIGRAARRARLSDAVRHPTDEELLCLVDGELPSREAARVRAHLDRCWSCRHRHARMRETIDAFMEACADGLLEDEAAFDTRRLPRPVVAALHDTASRASVFSHASHLRNVAGTVWRAARPSGAVGVRIGAAAAAVWLVIFLSSGPPVSARQLARQVERAERAALEVSTSPVVYQRLQLARRGGAPRAADSGTWDVWTDVSRRRTRALPARAAGSPDARRTAALAAETTGIAAATDSRPDDRRLSSAANALPRALFDLLRVNGARDAWPVSLRSHQQWRAQRPHAHDEIQAARTDTGEAALLLETTTDDEQARRGDDAREQGIVRATLLIRERDWHAVEQRLTVREGDETAEFVIREARFEVLSRAALPVSFFDEEAEGATRPPTVIEAARPRVAVPSVADLVTAEVQAMYALHRVGMTAADEISLHRQPRTIDVVGLTTTDERRRALEAALSPIPLVRARIRTADEVLAALLVPAPAAAPGVDSAPAAAPAPLPPMRFDATEIQADRLPAQALGRDPRAAGGDAAAVPSDRADQAAMRRAREAVQQSLTLLERAWALRRLAEWARRTNAGDVTTSSRSLIDVMLRERADAATQALAALDATVTPLLIPATAASPRPEPGVASPPADAAAAPSTSATPASAASPSAVSDPAASAPAASDAAATAAATSAPGASLPLASAASPAPATDDARPWTDVAIDFFGVAAEIDRDTRRLFTASPSDASGAATRPDEDARRLRRGLDAAARFLDTLPRSQP